MWKLGKRVFLCAAVVVLFWAGGLLSDAQRLREDILRLHVVANSDSQEDQAVKLQVRDAILAELQEGLADLTDMEQAVTYVQEMLPRLQEAANRTLAAAGFAETAQVSLTDWAFPRRDYETFSLPAGVYQALRVVIGDGQGQNWWCVVFPSLCLGQSQEEAVAAGCFSDGLSQTITGQREIRFWILDFLGTIGNFFFHPSESAEAVVQSKP